MKKYLFIALASLTVCVACSRKEQPAAPPAQEAWVSDESLPVPIRFSKGDLFSIETKASDLEPVTLTNAHFAISAIPRKYFTLPNASIERDMVWCDSTERLLLNSAMAKSDALGNISFVDGNDDVNYYYPMQGSKQVRANYRFVAYRTTTEDTDEPLLDTLHVSTDAEHPVQLKPYIRFELEPEENNVDVLWAESGNAAEINPDGLADNGDEIQGFNASYVRYLAQHPGAPAGGALPSLTFQHCAACIRFVVKAEDAAAETALDSIPGDNRPYTVKDIKIKGLYKDVTLRLLDGALFPQDTCTASTAFCHVVKGGKSIAPIKAAGEDYGYVFIAPGRTAAGGATPRPASPLRSAPLKIQFTTVAKDAQDDTGIQTQEIELPYPKWSGNPAYGAYEPGVIYTYNIVVKAPQDISITASIPDYTHFSGDYFDNGNDIVDF